MPDREQRTRQGRQRREVDFAERRRQAGVLHPYLDCQRAAGRFVEAKQFTAPVAAQQANGVMQHHRNDHHKAYGSYVRGGTRHHGADDRQNTDHRKRGQVRLNGLHHAREQVVNDQPQRNRDYYNLQNAQQHPHHVHLNMRIHVQAG